MSSSGCTGISLAGRWECGACGASGDGWWDEGDGLVLQGRQYADCEHPWQADAEEDALAVMAVADAEQQEMANAAVRFDAVLMSQNARLRAEIEHLRASTEAAGRVLTSTSDRLGDAEATIERLRADRAAVLREADGIGLCGYCGVPRESHHHSYVSTTAALAAAPHHISSEPGSLPNGRAAVDRVRHLVDRYQQWHEGGWAPQSAALVAREFLDALDGHEPRHTADETQQGGDQ